MDAFVSITDGTMPTTLTIYHSPSLYGMGRSTKTSTPSPTPYDLTYRAHRSKKNRERNMTNGAPTLSQPYETHTTNTSSTMPLTSAT